MGVSPSSWADGVDRDYIAEAEMDARDLTYREQMQEMNRELKWLEETVTRRNQGELLANNVAYFKAAWPFR